MKNAARVVEPTEQGHQKELKPLYLEALTLVERLHRRLLDVIKDEFDRRGRSDINSVQALSPPANCARAAIISARTFPTT
jgi:hypothetical protein